MGWTAAFCSDSSMPLDGVAALASTSKSDFRSSQHSCYAYSAPPLTSSVRGFCSYAVGSFPNQVTKVSDKFSAEAICFTLLVVNRLSILVYLSAYRLILAAWTKLSNWLILMVHVPFVVRHGHYFKVTVFSLTYYSISISLAWQSKNWSCQDTWVLFIRYIQSRR
jgi:hypothetical protein